MWGGSNSLLIAQEMSRPCLTLQRICPEAKVPMPWGLKTPKMAGGGVWWQEIEWFSQHLAEWMACFKMTAFVWDGKIVCKESGTICCLYIYIEIYTWIFLDHGICSNYHSEVCYIQCWFHVWTILIMGDSKFLSSSMNSHLSRVQSSASILCPKFC